MVAASKRTASEAGLSTTSLDIRQATVDSRSIPTSHSTHTHSPLKSAPMGSEMSRDPPSRRKADEPEGEWSVAESKSSRKKRRKVQQDSENRPSIRFLKTRPDRVQLKALQDLVLYVLADCIAPSWLAVNNAKQIRKVVVLMVPGLDQEMLENSELTDSICIGDSAGILNGSMGASTHPDKGAQDLSLESTDPSSTNEHVDDDSDFEGRDIADQRSLKGDLLQHIIEVRAPGDSRANRVHSPLQGMLIAPFPDNKEKGNSKDEKSFQAVRTVVADFIHSADDLREAEYPVHPASFTDPKDAQLEHQRRELTSQSSAAGWVNTHVTVSSPTLPSSSRSHDPLTQGLRVYALDCEMVVTSDDKHSLARISVIDWSGKTILDKYVKPTLPIINYFTEYSGITEKLLENVETTLKDIQTELLALFSEDTVLLGHSLESDLNALKLTHPFLIDTSIIYPHPRGLPLRSSLKFLANRYLKREIQKGGADGHDSVEDARAVLDLVRLKCEKGPRWGTLDANGESLFRRLGRTLKTDEQDKVVLKETAIVEYGTPERGFGKDATYKIACESDGEIVQGVLRAVHGDQSSDTDLQQGDDQDGRGEEGEIAAPAQGQKIPPGGADFVWARLRDLEAVRGWNIPPGAAGAASSTSPPQDDTNNSPDVLLATARRTLSSILHIWTHLPPRTLLILYSGTADMRPALRLQQQHAQYRREFKIKKWDELSIKWTDKEEQELKQAVEAARKGVGVLAVR